MTSPVTTLREHVQEQLQTDLGEDTFEITFVAGKLNATDGQRNIGCVYIAHAEPNRRDVNIRDEIVVVRVFLQRLTERDPTIEMPLDPKLLEDVELALIQSLQPVQDDESFLPGYFVWLSSEYDLDLYALECQFRTHRWSEWAKGG